MGMTDEEAMLHDTLSELKRQLRSSESGKIVLIGDVMMDCYIHGYANNLNSRAPVPVLRETSREEDVGAAAEYRYSSISKKSMTFSDICLAFFSSSFTFFEYNKLLIGP